MKRHLTPLLECGREKINEKYEEIKMTQRKKWPLIPRSVHE